MELTIQELNQKGLEKALGLNIKEATSYFLRSLALDPEQKLVHFFLGNCYKIERDPKKACEYYQKALQLDNEFYPALFGLAICQIPEVPLSYEEIVQSRQNYRCYLEELDKVTSKQSPLVANMMSKVIGSLSSFFLAYQGCDDLELQKLLGKIIHSVMSIEYPGWSKPLKRLPRGINEKIRVGFATCYFNAHSVWKIPLRGWLECLDRDNFEIFGYTCLKNEDSYTQAARKLCDHFTNLSNYQQLAHVIYRDKLHALIFPEIGMDPVTTCLASLRLAPVQAVGLGHPETTGLKTIDYFLSSDLMESSLADSYYSEKLVRLRNIGTHYFKNNVQHEPFSLLPYGVKEDDVIYLCAQMQSKYLPQYDWIFPEIAKRVPKAKFIFINRSIRFQNAQGKTDDSPSKQEYENIGPGFDCLRSRLQAAFNKQNLDIEKHMVVLPNLPGKKWAGLMSLGTVFLDSIGWSGFNTTCEVLEHHCPVVTLPGLFCRSRHSKAVLEMIGLDETIAKDENHYIELATRLGLDSSFRKVISKKIESNLHRLYNDKECIEDFENFLYSCCI